MRVLYVMDAFQLGGAERVVVDLATDLRRRGHEIKVATVRKSAPEDPVGRNMRQELLNGGVSVFEMAITGSVSERALIPHRLAKLIRTLETDLVHSHTDIPDFYVSMARRILEFRLVRTIHNTSLWSKHIVAGWLTEQGFRDDMVVGVSKAATNAYLRLRQTYRLPVSREVRTIMNGVSVPEHPLPSTTRRFSASDPLRVGFVGRYGEQKGTDILIEVIAKLCKMQLNLVVFEIVTDGFEAADLVALQRSFPDFVQLRAPEPSISHRLGSYDILIMPSRNEGLPLVALEALACGTPVIATDIDGLREAMPPHWPLLVPASSPTALCGAITEIVSGKYDLDVLAEQGYLWALQFSISEMTSQYERAYEDHLSVHRA
jgi:glycosyltransferase involved in cell wall biosynthesis